MGIKPLVSVISPCYNSEEFVGRMLDSITRQTYNNIEMICVNDGSTDNTEQVIESYRNRLEAKGMSLKLIAQSNQGQASALNNGLKQVTGDYLCWIDSDDFLTDDSVKSRLDILENNREYGICTSDLYIVNEQDIRKVIKYNSEYFGHLNFQRNQFYLAIVGLSSIECHAHMIRMSYFDKINPEREINCCRAGQNFQMLLPMYYYFPRYYLYKPLGYYVIREDSHYHSKRSAEEEITRKNDLLKMLSDILSRIDLAKWEAERLYKFSCFYRELCQLS